jgi:predicted RNA methylase
MKNYEGSYGFMNNDKAMGNSNFERIEADFYPTPSEVTEALIPFLFKPPFCLTDRSNIWEPACGTGTMSEVLKKYFTAVNSTDLFDYGYEDMDFIDEEKGQGKSTVDFLKMRENLWAKAIITNPPYGGEDKKIAEKFIRKALELTKENNGTVAMLLRKEYDSASGRNDLFSKPPFAKKIDLTWRPRWIPYKPGDKGPRHNYSWFLWQWGYTAEPTISYAYKKKS